MNGIDRPIEYKDYVDIPERPIVIEEKLDEVPEQPQPQPTPELTPAKERKQPNRMRAILAFVVMLCVAIGFIILIFSHISNTTPETNTTATEPPIDAEAQKAEVLSKLDLQGEVVIIDGDTGKVKSVNGRYYDSGDIEKPVQRDEKTGWAIL